MPEAVNTAKRITPSDARETEIENCPNDDPSILEYRFPIWVPGTRTAAFIDYTFLRPEANARDIAVICAEAKEYGFHSVCVSSGWVRLTREKLSGSPVKVSAVVGFPLGAVATRSKAFEAAAALEDGASEISMVISIGKLIDGEHEAVERDIGAVVQAVQGGALIKVILETASLTDGQKAEGCRIAEAAGADFVQTSTGFGRGGATVADIRLMRAAVSPMMGIKASGGIRNLASAQALLSAGAQRIGSSSGVEIVNRLESSTDA
ncbi:deoxyribose-phosphate aldolase [Cohnella faecalis]|uniref:Deoxyribose-phosphate aldolase n=1 Tax=Cohnella faecalis TaxID=2315694 RepID=A0A398CU05_9BACL|nr:deoxyribose-phosphate aldolase [Cohnella faecalis]RIE04188.1 deoxyribose-phosphate aldolase [Cohnella faecalis]